MNGYNLTRDWYSYKFDNVGKVKAAHSDMYFYIIDLWNRLGQKDNIGLPTSVTMECLGIGSYNTYKKTLQDLIDFGFVKLIKESKNQHNAKVIAISKIDKATDKALDKASIKATDKALDEPIDKATDTIDKQRNKGTRKQNNNITISNEFENELNILVMVFNESFKTNYTSIETLKTNYAYWREIYEPAQIEQSIINVSKDQFWRDKMTPTILFRQKNSNKEQVDYIGQFLNKKNNMPLEQMHDAFKTSLQTQLNKIRNQ